MCIAQIPFLKLGLMSSWKQYIVKKINLNLEKCTCSRA